MLTRIASGSFTVPSAGGDAWSTSAGGIYVAKVWTGGLVRGTDSLFLTWRDDIGSIYFNAIPRDYNDVNATPPVPFNKPSGFLALNMYVPGAGAPAPIPYEVFQVGAAPTVTASGSLLLTASQQTLASSSGPGTYVLNVGLDTMANGDEVTILINDHVLTNAGGGWRPVYRHAQAAASKYSPPTVTYGGVSCYAWQSAAPASFKTISYRLLQIS